MTTEHHYRNNTGISGYRAGDIVVNDDTGERSLAVSDGHGITLEPTDRAGEVSHVAPALPVAACGCTREQAYRHTPADGFSCRHGNKV